MATVDPSAMSATACSGDATILFMRALTSGRASAAAREWRRSSVRPSSSVKQRKIDRVSHRAVAQVARVKVVAAIVHRQHPGRMVGIAQRPVEIDDGVEGVGLAQPLVDLLADRLALWIPGAGQEGLV